MTDTDPLDAIGPRITQARDALKWSQGELARRTGLRPETISRYEAGKNPPQTREAVAIARALMVSVEWLLTGAESRVEYDSEIDPDIIDRVVNEAGLNPAQADELRRVRWSRGTSAFTLSSYARDIKALEAGKSTDRAQPDEPRANVVMDITADIQKRRR